jgi:hydrogenase expression/formation protein HypD
MKITEAFRDPELVWRLSGQLAQWAFGPATIMEVCGTHTMAVARFGLKSLLPPGVRLISGPGCPICVTAPEDLDAFLALGRLPNVVLATFGDVLRVPGSATSLERERARGVEVRVVYAPWEAVTLARNHPDKEVIFFGVGFETTMPATAVAVKAAAAENLPNFSVFSVHKTMPPALRALVERGEVRLSGFLLPGHVSTIIGTEAYRFLPEEFRLPCAVAGFEPLDILGGIGSLLQQLKEGRPRVANVYPRAVSSRANPRAQALLKEVFVPENAPWRGLGVIPGSGAGLGERYARFDARRRFASLLAEVALPPSGLCRCGEVLRGVPGSPGLSSICRRLHPIPPPGALHGLPRGGLRRGLPL